MTIDQYAILPSLCVGIAVTSVYWVFSLDWDAMGRLKLPILGAVLAIGVAIHQIQRYVMNLKQRHAQQQEGNL